MTNTKKVALQFYWSLEIITCSFGVLLKQSSNIRLRPQNTFQSFDLYTDYDIYTDNVRSYQLKLLFLLDISFKTRQQNLLNLIHCQCINSQTYSCF